MTRKRGDSSKDPSFATPHRANHRHTGVGPTAAQSPESSSPRLASPVPPLPPITHQPLIAISVVLMCASLGQLAAWLVNARLPVPMVSEASSMVPSAIVANPLPFTALQDRLDRIDSEAVPARRLLFRVCLVLGLLSTVVWYAATRKLLGPGWAMWAAAVWSLNPLFAFVAQRSTALTLVLFAVPLTWALLLWWSRSRRRRVAFVAGLAAGLTTHTTLAMPLAFALAAILLLVSLRNGRKSWQGFGLLWLGFAVPIAISLGMIPSGTIATPLPKFSTAVSVALDNNDGSVVARAMRAQAVLAVEGQSGQAAERWHAAWRELKRSPGELPTWLLGRAWRCLYATSDGRFQQPLFALNLAILVPAIWGALVCLHQRAWRWQAAAGIAIFSAFWLTAAIFEPLARSMAPVGCMLVVFALVAVADLYERAFGRRLKSV